jgi:hypothetical protein
VGGPLQEARAGPGNARGSELEWARRGPKRAGRGLRRLKTWVGVRVPLPEGAWQGFEIWELVG